VETLFPDKFIQMQSGAAPSKSLSKSSSVINQQQVCVCVCAHVHVPCLLLVQGKFLVRSRLAL